MSNTKSTGCKELALSTRLEGLLNERAPDFGVFRITGLPSVAYINRPVVIMGKPYFGS